ncbi:hypothetical protein X971_0190 [Agrobacterium tumefaciens LBA4213 (Ach5)]|nr:hypothetical protein X971_0190 [Agrobacterium tumefaciens LBA4213 (Ach5)]
MYTFRHPALMAESAGLPAASHVTWVYKKGKGASVIMTARFLIYQQQDDFR